MLDLDEVDEKDDPFKYAKFETLTDKNEFIYIDYPYEIYGTAKPMDKNLPATLNKWLFELTNYEEDEVEVSFFSLNEDALTIQSTYFFLSKIGTRVRKVVFPKDFTEVENDYDVVVTGNKALIDNYLSKNDNITTVLITNTTVKEYEDNNDKVDLVYDSLESMINDDKFLSEIQKNKK